MTDRRHEQEDIAREMEAIVTEAEVETLRYGWGSKGNGWYYAPQGESEEHLGATKDAALRWIADFALVLDEMGWLP